MFGLIPWQRSREFMDLRDELDGMLDSFFQGSPRGLGKGDGAWVPAVDVTETDREIVLKAEVPGMEQGDIDVSFRKGILTIRGERKEETEERRGEMRRVERRRGSFERSFHIPMDVDVENAKAEYSKGILTVNLPKVETDGARKIEVKAA